MAVKYSEYTIIMLMTATKEWLSLSREQRNAFTENKLNPLFARYAGKVSVRLLDAEAFTARCSDVAIFEAADLRDFYFLVEELRDTEVYTAPYFVINEIIPAIEGGFMDFERKAGSEKR